MDLVTSSLNVWMLGLLILWAEETLNMRRNLTDSIETGPLSAPVVLIGAEYRRRCRLPPFVRYLCPPLPVCTTPDATAQCVRVWVLCCSICRQSGWAGVRLHVVLFMAAFSCVMESLRGFDVGGRHELRWPLILTAQFRTSWERQVQRQGATLKCVHVYSRVNFWPHWPLFSLLQLDLHHNLNQTWHNI